jgi:hypothetical protein
MRIFLVLSGVFAAVGQLAQAQAPPQAPWALDAQSTGVVSVPADIRRAAGNDLDYNETDQVQGVAVDLNGDGTNEYLLRSTRLCGSGGCVYALFDGATRRQFGRFYGSPLVVRAERVHGYPKITTYSHQNAESGDYTEHSFDGTVYVVTSERRVEGAAANRLFEELRLVPVWRPRP